MMRKLKAIQQLTEGTADSPTAVLEQERSVINVVLEELE